MALSNIMSMMQTQQNDFHAATNLLKMGCKPEHPTPVKGGGLAEMVAQGCPKDDVELSKAVQAELAMLHSMQGGGAQSAHSAHGDKSTHSVQGTQGLKGGHDTSHGQGGGLSNIMSMMSLTDSDTKAALAIGKNIEANNKKLDGPMNDFFAKTGRKPAEVNLQSKLASDKVHSGFESMLK